MFTNTHDLYDFVEQRNRDLRREAAAYRLSQAFRLTLVPRPSVFDRLRARLARLHIVRHVPNRSEAPA